MLQPFFARCLLQVLVSCNKQAGLLYGQVHTHTLVLIRVLSMAPKSRILHNYTFSRHVRSVYVLFKCNSLSSFPLHLSTFALKCPSLSPSLYWASSLLLSHLFYLQLYLSFPLLIHPPQSPPSNRSSDGVHTVSSHVCCWRQHRKQQLLLHCHLHGNQSCWRWQSPTLLHAFLQRNWQLVAGTSYIWLEYRLGEDSGQRQLDYKYLLFDPLCIIICICIGMHG